MLITIHEKMALADLRRATSISLARCVSSALRKSETDDIAEAIGLHFAVGKRDAREVLETLPQNLRCGARGILMDGRETWGWLAWAWLRHHGTEYDISRLSFRAGCMAYEVNVQWDAP